MKSVAAIPVYLIPVINKTIDALRDCYVTHQHELTERERIRCQLELLCRQIDSATQLKALELDYNHRERISLITSIGSAIAIAAQNSDHAMFACLYDLLLKLNQVLPPVPEVPVLCHSAQHRLLIS